MDNLNGYKAYIVEKGFVQDEKSGYYAAWVARFLLLRLSDNLRKVEKLRQFRGSLLVDGRLQEWRVKQALHSAELQGSVMPCN